MKYFYVIFATLSLASIAALGYKYYSTRNYPKDIPEPIAHQAFTPTSTPLSPETLPQAINLKVPFTSQAPNQNWEDPYGELCEEASSLMAVYFIENRTIPSTTAANQELLNIKDFEVRTLGYYKDTTAQETATTILQGYFSLKKDQVKLISNPTINIIQQNLAQGKVVLVPAAGRLLPNPNFRSPGPLYHMLLIKGYTKDGQFITNDPGTRKGADFLYKYDDLMNALHDWNDGDVLKGNKVIIVVG